MLEKVRIRSLSYSDLVSVLAIERDSFPNPWSMAMFMLELSKPLGIAVAALNSQGALVGYLVCSRYAGVWHLMNIAVSPDHRRLGIATTMLEHLFERTSESDQLVVQLTLEVRLSNGPAIAMYRRHGFVSSGVRRGYYQDDDEDALIMWRTSDRGQSMEIEPGSEFIGKSR